MFSVSQVKWGCGVGYFYILYPVGGKGKGEISQQRSETEIEYREGWWDQSYISDMASSILTRCLRQGLIRSGETLAPVSSVQQLHTSNTVQGTLAMPERLQNIPQAAVSISRYFGQFWGLLGEIFALGETTTMILIIYIEGSRLLWNGGVFLPQGHHSGWGQSDWRGDENYEGNSWRESEESSR